MSEVRRLAFESSSRIKAAGGCVSPPRNAEGMRILAYHGFRSRMSRGRSAALNSRADFERRGRHLAAKGSPVLGRTWRPFVRDGSLPTCARSSRSTTAFSTYARPANLASMGSQHAVSRDVLRRARGAVFNLAVRNLWKTRKLVDAKTWIAWADGTIRISEASEASISRW